MWPAVVLAQGAGADSVTLRWTAPGDDGNVGTASAYDLRVSTSTIHDANWAAATPVGGLPAPRAAGASQSATVRGLTRGVVYYFAIRSTDEAGNVSAISNVLRWDWATTGAPPSPPAVSGAVWTMAPAYPNPSAAGGPVTIPVEVPTTGAGRAELHIAESGGRIVRRLALAGLGDGSQSVTWDGRNDSGALTAPGVYTAWLVGGGARRGIKIVRIP